LKYCVLGAGINFNSDFDDEPELKEKAVSLKGIDRNAFIARLLDNADAVFELSKAEIVEEYKKRSLLLGKEFLFITESGQFLAECTDIDGKGALIVRLKSGEVKRLDDFNISVKGEFI
jgi:BirA family biotin operon repressor/biotin-[acetyl-CoA-carboxylase] ligase